MNNISKIFPYRRLDKSYRDSLYSLVVECWLQVRHVPIKDRVIPKMFPCLAFNIKRETLALSQIAIIPTLFVKK